MRFFLPWLKHTEYSVRMLASPKIATVRLYFCKKYGTLVWYVFFVMVRVRFVRTVRFKN